MILTCYIVVLVLASLAGPSFSLLSGKAPIFGSLTGIAARSLSNILVVPGLDVFHQFRKLDWKPRGNCIEFKTVQGETLKPLFRTEQFCRPPSFQLAQDTQSVMYMQILQEAWVDHLFPAKSRNTVDSTSLSREKTLVLTLANAFCHSVQSGTPTAPKPGEQIAVAWSQRAIEYKTGWEQTSIKLISQWDCSPLKLVHLHWWPKIDKKLIDSFYANRALE